MATTPTESTLTIPAHLYAHTEVAIHDNTIRTYTRAANDNCRILAVFMSPKGVDRKMVTIDGGLEQFDQFFGVGPYSTYGQPLLNARAAANTGNVTLQCLRISAPDATYANNVVWVQYKATAAQPAIEVGDVITPATYYTVDEYNEEPIYYPDDDEDHAGEIQYAAGEYIVHHRGDVKTAAVLATEEDARAATAGKLQVRFVASPFSNVYELEDFDAAFDNKCINPVATGGDSYGSITLNTPTPAAGWSQLPFIAVASRGRGSYGNNLRFRISNHPRADKANDFKNYFLRIFEGTRTIEDATRVTLADEVVNNRSIFMQDVVNGLNNGTTGSTNVHMKVNTDVLSVLYNLYTADGVLPTTYNANGSVAFPTHLSEAEFDPILGIDKFKALARSADFESFMKVTDAASGMDNFEILSDTDTVQFNTLVGIGLSAGSDGCFALTSDPARAEIRRKNIRAAYYYAFYGDTTHGYDRDIASKTKFPLDAVFDADFPIGVSAKADEVIEVGSLDEIAHYSLKKALADLVDKRHEDCFCFMDLGTDKQSMLDPNPGEESGFVTKEAAWDYSTELEDDVWGWEYSIDAYYGKIRDPFNKKVVTVTSTYNLIVNYPNHWKYYGGKHIPYAGSKYGPINQYIPNTVFPVFDVDLDSDHLDKMVDKHVNYAQINLKQAIIRGSQTTRWPEPDNSLTISNLTETNNALIVLDIKKDAIKLVENYAYNFNEASDIALFNRDAEQLVTKYRDAQVRSISATFSRTEEEAELGILHLHIVVIHKALVKINLIDIDVNRAVDVTTS